MILSRKHTGKKLAKSRLQFYLPVSSSISRVDQSLLPTGETNHMTCLLPGMCFTFWKEGFYEARHSDRDTERTDLSSSWFYYNLNATLSATPTRPIRDNASCIMMSENPTNRERSVMWMCAPSSLPPEVNSSSSCVSLE